MKMHQHAIAFKRFLLGSMKHVSTDDDNYVHTCLESMYFFS